MKRYILERVAYSLLVMWAVATLVFFMMRAIPGDPVRAMVGFEADPQTVAQIRHNLGLDQPFIVQYLRWLLSISQLDLGNSIWNQQPVTILLWEALPRTLSLASLSFSIAVALGIPAGIVSAVRRYSLSDHVFTVVAFLGLSMPDFWLGILLLLFLLSVFRWLPPMTFTPLWRDPVANLSQLIWPALAVGYRYSAVATRMTRSAMLEVLREDYVRTAWAKGLAERAVVLRHALRNALLPVVTVIGLEFAFLIGGLVVTEQVFNLNGVGKLFVDAIARRDYTLIQGLMLLVASAYVLVNVLLDLLYARLDPRIRYA